jgi:hypothetical protein
VPLRHGVVGAALLGVPGAVAGLIIGLIVYVPNAWFATFELGIPAAVVGGVLGLLAGSAAPFARRSRRRGDVN